MEFAPGMADLLAETIRDEINENSAKDNPSKRTWRVSPASLGKECVAQLWFKYRWVHLPPVDGRMARLYKRGNNEEKNFTAMLRRAGWEVRDYTKRLCYHPESDSYFAQEWEDDVTQEVLDVSESPEHIKKALGRDKWILQQWRVKQFGGHYSGYLDGKARHPIHTNGEWILVEYKTYNTKRFTALVAKKAVKITDYEYHCQAVQYMDQHQLPWCLFCAQNKNDDDIYFEAIVADPALALSLLQTAHTIATSQARPARIAESPAFHKCKICEFTNICHKSAPVDINCRSCQHCVADLETDKFRCTKWSAIIPNEKAILEACPQHLPLV